MAAMSSATVRRSPSTLRPIIALRRKPSIDGSVTATICTTPDSMRRWTRWRTAASDRPTCLASLVYGIRPSSWSPSISALSMSSMTTTAVDRSAGSRSLRDIGLGPVCRSGSAETRDSVPNSLEIRGFSGQKASSLRKSCRDGIGQLLRRCQDLVAGVPEPGEVRTVETLAGVEAVQQHEGVEPGQGVDAEPDRVDRAQARVRDQDRESGADRAGQVDVVAVGGER